MNSSVFEINRYRTAKAPGNTIIQQSSNSDIMYIVIRLSYACTVIVLPLLLYYYNDIIKCHQLDRNEQWCRRLI